jgi:hypothetical protein
MDISLNTLWVCPRDHAKVQQELEKLKPFDPVAQEQDLIPHTVNNELERRNAWTLKRN